MQIFLFSPITSHYVTVLASLKLADVHAWLNAPPPSPNTSLSLKNIQEQMTETF